MTELNQAGRTFKVNNVKAHSFELEDTSSFSAYKTGGIVTEVCPYGRVPGVYFHLQKYETPRYQWWMNDEWSVQKRRQQNEVTVDFMIRGNERVQVTEESDYVGQIMPLC